MSVKDIRSDLKQNVALTAAVTGNGTTNGAAIDTAEFELGLMFAVAVNNFTDGSYAFVLEESVDSAFTVPIAIVGDKLIGTLAGLTATAASASGAKLNTIGVISNLQFVRINVVATGVTTGADILSVVTQKAENMPVV